MPPEDDTPGATPQPDQPPSGKTPPDQPPQDVMLPPDPLQAVPPQSNRLPTPDQPQPGETPQPDQPQPDQPQPHPYADLPASAYWRSAVAEAAPGLMADLYTPRFAITRQDRLATAGSCFAQHVGQVLAAAGFTIPAVEQALPGMPPRTARRFGFGLYPARYGNIYTARQLRQLIEDCLQRRTDPEAVWEKDGRFFDALRPSVEPFGMQTPDAVLQSRRLHLQRVCDLLHNIDVLIFTLGLTETWEDIATGRVYPSAPGTIAGAFDPARHRLRNLSFSETLDDMQMVINHLRAMSPGVRFLLTVSPVPLTATASGDHVLAASTRSKAILRAVAAELCARNDCADYFPAYEIVTAPQMRGSLFEPNLRSVTDSGVRLVMQHFLAAHDPAAARSADIPLAMAPASTGTVLAAAAIDPVCEEILQDPAVQQQGGDV